MSAEEVSPEDWSTEAGTAHHEAGHFVALRRLRADEEAGDPGLISIIPNEEAGSLGHHAPIDGCPRERYVPITDDDKLAMKLQEGTKVDIVVGFAPLDVENYIVQLYAGGAADLRHNPGSMSAKWHLSDPTSDEEEEAEVVGPFEAEDSDRHKAEAWLAYLAPDRKQRAALRAELRDRAMAFVEEHWDDICAVAAELLKKKTIDGFEADFAIRIAAGDGEAAGELERYLALRGDL